MSTTTVQQLIDAARIRHWSFAELTLGDGAALLFLNERQRTHLARHGAKIEGIVGTSMTYDVAPVNGLLLGSVSGVPVLLTTYQDGWPAHDDGTGVPYVDFTEPAIATDPFGAHGGMPGFPLPADMVRLIAVSLTYNQSPGTLIPCTVVNERERFTILPGRNPNAFVSGNRLVPCLPQTPESANTADRWFNVSALQISYVGIQTLTALGDEVVLPSVLTDALIADLANLFAMSAKDCPATDKSRFEAAAVQAGTLVDAAALDLLESPVLETVIYNG